jgi:hypothetical protein
VRHIEGVVAAPDQLGLRTTSCTRPHPHDACFTRFGVISEEHAGMVDLGAGGDPDNR